MASGGGEEDDGGIPLDIDNVHMLLQVEHEQIQKRTFTNWINAQLAKRCPPSFVSDLFTDLREGSQLLDLLEVMSSQPMKRQRGKGVFQQRANIETALNFLKKKSVQLVNINIPDIIDGRPSIILGLIWTVILHCHIEELASTLSYSSCHSSLDSLASLDSWSGSPLPSSPAPLGRTSPLHRRFRLSAKKALLMWVRDQCLKVGCSISVKNFKSSWRSGEAFLAILSSLRPQLADLSLVQLRSNLENLEEAFHLAERELHIPRLLEPQDVDVKDPDEKSIMTYVAQFLQYSNDMPAQDDHLQLFPQVQPFSLSPVNLPAHFPPAIAVSPLRQVSSTERALEVTSWLQRAYQELSEARAAAENSSFVEKYHVLQSLAGSITEQRRPVMTPLLAAIRHGPELSREQCALRTAWDCLEKEVVCVCVCVCLNIVPQLQGCKVDLDSSLPPPLDSVVVWLQRAEASLTEEGGRSKDHADAAKEARARQDAQKALMTEMSYFVNIIATFRNTDDLGNIVVPIEKFNEIKRSLTNIRVTAKYEAVKLEYQEIRHTVLDLLGRVNAKLVTWKAPYRSQEAVLLLLQDWHETVEHHGLLFILMDALQNLKEKANTYTSKAALGEDAQLVTRQLKESESEADLVTQAVTSVRGTLERAACVWETYNKCLASLQAWLAQNPMPHAVPPTVGTQQDMSEWTSCQARLNEAGSALIEVTEYSASLDVAEQLTKVNRKWAEHVKRTTFAVLSEPSVGPRCLQMVHSLTQEASGLLRMPLEVSSASLKANRQKLQLMSKKMAEVDLSSLGPSQYFPTSETENLQQHLPKMLDDAERACGELQRAASGLEGRLAELDHWSTEAMDCCQHQREKRHRRSAWESAAKVLISRGVQLEKQVIAEGKDLQDLVARVQTTSPLLHLSTSVTQDRISEAVSHCQEILEMFGSVGVQQHGKSAHQTRRQSEAGLFVVAKTKQVDPIGNVQLAQDPKLVSPELLSQTSRQRALHGWAKNQNGSTTVNPCVETQTLPGPLREPIVHIHCPLTQTIKEAEPEHMIQPRTLSERPAQASSWSHYDQVLPALIQTPFGLNGQKTPKRPVPEEKQRSAPSQTCVSESRINQQPHSVQSVKTPLKPPVMVRSEVHSKAQSMARSRLEKARFRLQGRIQQAIKLFGGKQISESQIKRKQRALKILQPVFLDEFLGAVEGLTAFSTGPKLHDLMLLSDSVRKQWEDISREMAAFIPILSSKIREGKQSSSVVQCETQTNALHEAHKLTDHDSLPQQQAVTEGAASVKVEPLQELCETLTPRRSSCLATDQLKESDEDQEIHPSDTVLASDRGRQLRGAPPLRATGEPADTQQSNSLPQKQSVDSAQRRRVSPVSAAASAQPRGEAARLQSQHDPTLLDKERLLKACLWQNQAHIQVVVRGNTVETKQEAEWTVLPESAAATQEEQTSGQEVLGRYRKSCVIFQLQLLKNKQHLEEFISDPVTISALHHRKTQLQALKEETDALWFDYELQYTRQSQFNHLMSKEDKDDMEKDREQLTQQWRGQQMSLQSRVPSPEITAGPMTLVTEKLDRLTKESVDISSFTVADPTLVSDIKEMDEALQSEMSQLPERASEEEIQFHPSILVTGREVKAETPTPLAKQDPSRQPNEAEWKRGTHSWQTAMQQKLLTATKQSNSVDSTLKAAGMTLTIDGAGVTCRDVVTSLSRQAVDVEEEVARANKRDSEGDLHTVGREKIQAFEPMEEEVELVAKSSRPERDNDVNSQRHKEHKPQTRKSENGALKAVGPETRSSIQVKKEVEETFVQRRVALSSALKEIREAAEQLRLQEPTLPALQHRTRALTKLDSRLAVHLAELQHAQDAASQSGMQDVSPSREVEEAWEEASRAVTERLEQCEALTELLKRFQSIHGELSGTLQRAESTIREQASYMGKDNLQRLHTKVQETKAELIGLSDGIEEVRSVYRQLHTHLRQIPEGLSIPFEDETEAMMDRWLDVSEKTDSYLENLHHGLTLWDGILQLGAAVESWTSNKLAVVAQCPSFQTEEDIRALQSEIVTQEDYIERFHRRVAEIPPLLRSKEPPLELQVVETQIRKKMKQLKEFVSEAEDLYRQKEAAKGQITARMVECFNSLQKIQESLLTLSASDVPTVLAKLKGLLFELQTRDEQAQSLQQDLRVMASAAGAGSLHGLPVDGTRLQDEVRNTHQLFSEVEEQTERNIRALDRLQSEGQHLEQWLQGVVGKAATDGGLMQEEALEQRVRTQALDQLVSSLQSSTLRQSALLEESSELLKRYHNFETRVPRGPTEKQSSVSRDVEACQTPSKSSQSPVGHHRQTPDSPLWENHVPHHRAAISEMAEDEAHLQELRVTGSPLSHGVGLNQDIQRSIKGSMQKSEAPLRDFLQPGRSCPRILQVDPDFTSTFLNQIQPASSRVEEPQRGTLQLPTLFPGSCPPERKHVCSLASQLQDEADPLQLTLTHSAEQRTQTAEHTSEKDPPVAELDTRCSLLMDELKGVCSSLEQGVCNEEHFGKSLQDCCHKLTSLQEKMSTCPARKESSAELITDAPALQPQTRDSMQPERTAPAGEASGGSPDSHKRRSTARNVLPALQSLVESSNVTHRTRQIDFNWHLKSFPGESQIRLVRAVQNVLACRYQPAQLDVSAMAKQLQEAEDCRRCVQEQVANMKSMSGARVCDPDGTKRSERQLSAALLDASATVQVKAAQLDQVKDYHKRMKITRAFLEVVAAEKDKLSLSTLRSSALQADKLQALLQAMVQKKDTMEELLQLSRRFSVHLSDAESSGALLAQLGNVQEEWRLLEGSIKRALQHASSSTSQYSLLIGEAEQLKANLDALQPSTFQSHDSKSAFKLLCLRADIKLYNQLYMHLQSQTDALVHFTLGQKEKDELSRSLKDLGSVLNVTKSKLDPSNNICGGLSSTKINEQLQDLIIWAKQAENHISVSKKLALFPEEARVQIVEMKKFQTDIWFRRSKMQTEIENMKAGVPDMENEESDHVLKTVQDLYEAIADSLNRVLDTMKKNLQERETLLCQFSSIDAWLAETHAQRDPCAHVDNVSKADIGELESELKSHKLAAAETEAQLKRVDAMADACREIAVSSSPGESRYLVNRLSGLWTELRGLLAHEEALSWELEELIHELTTSNEEVSVIQASLKQISTDLVRQRFPLTQETLSTTAHLKHTLMEHRCQVRGLKQFQEARRSSILCTVGELQDQCKALSINAVEQEKYLHLRRQMVESRGVLEEQIQRAKDESITVGERVMLCQSLLVELPLVKTQCQEVADQLETIAEELEPSDLNPEKERIHSTVEALVSWEHSVTDDIKSLEAKLLLGLRFPAEHRALIELFQRTRVELDGEEPVTPDEEAIDIALTRNLIIWRHMESGMRVLEGLGRKEKVDLKNYKELYSLRDVTMQDCHLRMERLCQARESLKDYNWAAQGAIRFLHNAEATFLSAPGGFLDCTEEQAQTQQALKALEDGFHAHICHLGDLVPNQPCLSRPKTEQLHISILSQLLVGRAILEAQAQLRMESLRRCEIRQQSHRKCHKDIRQRLSGLEIKLSECATEQVTSSDKSVAQQKRATLLLEGLLSLAGQLDELRAGCPAQSCGVGKDGELGALWRRWVSLRRGVGILIAHTEQRGEEWKDITTSMEQSCSFLARLQSEVPDSSTVSFSQEEPLELLAQAEVHRAWLQQEQQVLSSLEHRLEHALGLSRTQEPTSPGPVAKTLVMLQDKVKSLKERNLLLVAAAQAEDKERQQVQVEIAEWEQHMSTLLPSLEACPDLCKQQELRQDLSSQKDQLECITDGVQRRYAEIPAGISRRLQEAQLSLQRGEDKFMEKSNRLPKLDSQVADLVSGLERFSVLLEQRSPTVNEAQNAIKHSWDELDAWHSRLMLLESKVQDLAEEHPDKAHLLMDQLNRPLQLYQNAAQMTEQRTAFLSKVPACLQEFEDIMHGAACWLDEAQSWLSAPCSFPTARGLQNHANSLQLVLDDSERIRHTLQAFGPVLDEISAVCDVRTHKERLNQNDRQVQKMQCEIQQPLEQILQAVGVVEAIEAELKTMEKNVPKIRAILSSIDDTHTTLMEHLQNRQVILANVQSMQRTLEEMERCKGELHLPQGARESLVVFSRARLLLQPLEELQRLTRQQAALLQNKIREEKDKWNDLGIIAVSGSSAEVYYRDRSPQKVQEALELSNSEEEEEDDNHSCHSSSSDTLTCSIPEDPEETLSASDGEKKEIAKNKQPPEVPALQSLAGAFTSEVKTSSESAEVPGLSPGNHRTTEPESEHVETGLIERDSIVGEACGQEIVTIEPPMFSTAAAKLDSHGSPQCESPVTDPHAAAAAAENTRLIHARPKTPFAAPRGSDGFTEEADTLVYLSVCPHQHLVQNTAHVSKKWREESPRAREMSEERISIAQQEEDYEEDNKGELRWSRLNTQIFQKLITLKKVKNGHQIGSEDRGTHGKDPERELTSAGSASAVLLRTQESITMLRQIVSFPGVNDTLYEAARKVLVCLDALTDLLLTPGDDDPQLRMLQQECVSTELVTLCEMLSKVESGATPTLSMVKPEALRCLASLGECLQMGRLVTASSHNQLIEHRGDAYRHQEHASSQLWHLDEFEVEPGEMFPNIKGDSILEQCVHGRHQRESPEVKANLQQVSRALLRGITNLLELAEECITEEQMSHAHNCSQLEANRCRRKKLLGALGSQLAFVQHLFQREPGALECQEVEQVQLSVRAKALLQQAVQQDVVHERRIEEWTHFEDNSGRVGGLLDDVEAFLSSGEPEGDNGSLAQHRQAACQQALARLDDSRGALGLLLDQRKALQTDPEFAAKVGQAGGALELRWLSTCRRTQQESRRCRDIRDSQDRFHTDFASVSRWLAGAEKYQKIWTNLANSSDLNQECVCTNLITLLDFSLEMEAMSVQRVSASREAMKLLRLREADCPELRAQLAQLERSWTQLTSDLSTVRDSLQQVLAPWPPVQLLSHLEDWRKKLEDRLSLEKETLAKAEGAAQITENLQHDRELKAGILNALLLLDFLCQSGPQPVGHDVRVLRSERTVCAEQLGALRLHWLHLQGELEGQTREAEQTHYTCADRERRLQRLHSWIEQQKKQLNQWKQPCSQSAACEAVLQLEAAMSKVKEGCAALEELKSIRVQVETEEDRPCDVSFSGWTESVCRAYEDLSQQMEALQPALQLNVGEWSCYESNLMEVSIHTARVRCALQHQPLYSLKQAEGHQDLIEQLRDKVRKGETLWVSVDKCYLGLAKKVHPGTAQALDVQMRGERKRWKAVVQELGNEHTRNAETVRLWREYTQLSDGCSLDLLTLWRQWEELWRSSPGETQDMVHSVEKLQNAAEDLHCSVGDVLGAFKPLIERLEPRATNVIQSEIRTLSREVLLLIEAMSTKKKCLQDDLEQQELFRTLLEALEKQAQSTQHKLLTRFNNTDTKQALLELSDLFPSLVDVREMSCYVSLTNHETERLHMLSMRWVESMTHASDINRELQAERQCSQNLQQQCKTLAAIQKTIEEQSMSEKCQSISSLRDMMTVHKRLEAEIIIGNGLVHGLLCHALESMETERGGKSSELLAQVNRVRESWFHSLALAGQRRSSTKEQLGYWRVYQRGSKLLCRLLREGDNLLSSAGPAVFTVHQLASCTDDDQCVKDALGVNSSVFTRTLGAGRQLCETMTESECQSQLQSELQALQDGWERTTSLLERRRDRISTAVQKWTECQNTITSITSELEELRTRLKQPAPEELQDFKGDKHIQETDLLLQHFTAGFRELATMKTDMSQYVAAGDSALLEQQLEQLHSQWEELCTKVSSRRQEIADRLNGWTIFNDKNKEFCDWLTQMENKVCHSGELSIEEMVEKLKKDCMEEINLFSENKSHLKQLGEQLLLASDEAKRTQVHASLQEVNQRWHNLFHQIEARVKKLKETLVAVQQLDKNMSNLRSWLSRIEAELSRPITYSVCHLQEIQRRLVEQQELQRDIEQHTEGVVSVLSLCDVLLRDGDAAGSIEAESDSLQETSNSLDQRWRAVCAIAVERRLRIEETWRLWCKFLDDYSRFEDWLKMAERTAANPNSADVLYTLAKEELKKFEGLQRQVHERLTQLELVNNQYRRLARENRTDRASQLKAMVHEGNRRWDNLHRRVSAILRRLKHFTGQREEFEGTRESMLVWLTELDLQLTNVEHFSESDVHHKIQQLNSFQKEITVNTERIDGLIVFGEGLIQRSSLQDAALIEDELEELHSYCQEVFSRLVRFHQRLSQPPRMREELALSGESSLELICRPWLMRSPGSLPATPTRLLASPPERSGRETPASVDSLPLEWDHTGDVGGSSSHEDEEAEEEEEQEDDRTYFSAPSEVELTESQEEFVEAPEALRVSSLVLSTSMAEPVPPRWRSQRDTEAQLDSDRPAEAPRPLTSTPLKQGYLLLMSDCSGSIEDIKRVSLILNDEEQPEDLGLTGLCAADKHSGVIERWELLQAQSRSPKEARHLPSDLNDITSWLKKVTPELKRLQSEPAASIKDMASSATKLKEMQRKFTRYKSIMLSVNLHAQEAAELDKGLAGMNRAWSTACAGLQQWERRLRETLMRCKEFHESLHSLLLWLAHAESRRYAADISDSATPVAALQQHLGTLTDLQKELRVRQTQQASLQALWCQLQPEDEEEETAEAKEKLHVTSSKLQWLLREVEQDLGTLQQRLDGDAASDVQGQNTCAHPKKGSLPQRGKRDSPPPRSFFSRVLRAAFPLHLLFVFLLLLPCLIPLSESDSGCTGANNFARSFYPMLRYTNGPPPT
ncbi:nesprin-2a isoform 3-T3 [Spinachia spinachia]